MPSRSVLNRASISARPLLKSSVFLAFVRRQLLGSGPIGSKIRQPETVLRDADRHTFYQHLFFGQWERLRHYASAQGVGIIGDVPIFARRDRTETWQNRAVFRLDPRGQPLAV